MENKSTFIAKHADYLMTVARVSYASALDVAESEWEKKQREMKQNKKDVKNDAPKKYRYKVALLAEDITEGTVVLTKEEAALIARATNPSNWDDLHLERYSGTFIIDLEHPKRIKE